MISIDLMVLMIAILSIYRISVNILIFDKANEFFN